MNDGLSLDQGRSKEPRSEKRRRSGERGKGSVFICRLDTLELWLG